MKQQNILGYQIEAREPEHIFSEIRTVLDGGEQRCFWLACLNPHSYAVAKRDPEFAAALQKADWLVPDGVGILIAGRLLRRAIKKRITGTDIFEGVMADLNLRSGSVFFLGGSEHTLMLIREKLAMDYPSVRLVGTLSPPFKAKYTPEEMSAMVTAISATSPDVLWVGMTAPKQEKWIASLNDRLDVRFAAAIGATFDFYTGQVRRSHPVLQQLGLEWLPRLLQQPRRLWPRMFVSAPVFLKDVIRQALDRIPM